MAHWVEGEAREGFEKEGLELLALLEAQLKGNKFFGGDRPGYLDIAASLLGPWRSVVEEVTGVTVAKEEEHPALCQWARDYSSNEALRPCIPDRDRLLAYFTKNKEMYRAGVRAMLQQ
ncbi:putative glutathione S-transferase [Panicum miliaceum]|uniref:Glutathione S-transferase n=1 Tax=Panicum miliaceum TaxID=4540 RepID=A0A3L6PQM3_PANMI|nr:putative glutathione S-transferase [Panicum miliaceum]